MEEVLEDSERVRSLAENVFQMRKIEKRRKENMGDTMTRYDDLYRNTKEVT